jgi:hypothetical protein
MPHTQFLFSFEQITKLLLMKKSGEGVGGWGADPIPSMAMPLVVLCPNDNAMFLKWIINLFKICSYLQKKKFCSRN